MSPSLSTSYARTILRWSRAAAAWASRWKRARYEVSATRFLGSTLIATRRCISTCSARYTLLMPPVPSRLSSLYLPRKKPLCRPSSSRSHCQRVSSSASIIRSARASTSSGSGCKGARNASRRSGSTSLLRSTRSRNVSTFGLVMPALTPTIWTPDRISSGDRTGTEGRGDYYPLPVARSLARLHDLSYDSVPVETGVWPCPRIFAPQPSPPANSTLPTRLSLPRKEKEY